MKNIYQFLFSALCIFIAICSIQCSKKGLYYDVQVDTIGFNGNIMGYLQSKTGHFDSLLKVIQLLEMEPYLEDSTVTLFAPQNEAFQLALQNYNAVRQVTGKTPQYLETIKRVQLDTMMAQYIVSGRYVSKDFAMGDGLKLSGIKYDKAMAVKLNQYNASGFYEGGAQSISFIDMQNSQFERDWVTASATSINNRTSNGIVHILATDHVFAFNNFVSRLTYVPPPANLFLLYSGKDTVSKENSGGVNASEASKYAFDTNAETKYMIGGFVGPQWLQFEFDAPVVANAYTITSANDAQDRDPTDWNLEGSNDTLNFTTLDVRLSEVFDTRMTTRVFRFSNKTPYKFYRLTIIRNNGSNDMQLAGWTMNYGEE